MHDHLAASDRIGISVLQPTIAHSISGCSSTYSVAEQQSNTIMQNLSLQIIIRLSSNPVCCCLEYFTTSTLPRPWDEVVLDPGFPSEDILAAANVFNLEPARCRQYWRWEERVAEFRRA